MMAKEETKKIGCPRCNKILDCEVSRYPEDLEKEAIQITTRYFHEEEPEGHSPNSCDYHKSITENLRKKEIIVEESPKFITFNFPLKVYVEKTTVDGELQKTKVGFSSVSQLDAEQIIRAQIQEQLGVPEGFIPDGTYQVISFRFGFKKE